MRKVGYAGALLAMLLVVSAEVAKADGKEVKYTLKGPGVSASFMLTADPSVTSSKNGADFTVLATNVTLDGLNIGTYTLEFMNASQGGGFEVNILGVTFDLSGAQLFTGTDSSPVMSTGNFSLDNGWFKLSASAVATPEPATLLLFGSGLLGFGFFARRRAAK